MKLLSLLILYSLLVGLKGHRDFVQIELAQLPIELDVRKVRTVNESRLINLLGVKLFDLDDRVSFSPSLASKFYWKDSGKKLFIELKENVHFSDSSSVSVHDVISSLVRCIVSSDKTLKSLFKNLTNYEGLIKTKDHSKTIVQHNKSTIQINLERKSPLILEGLSHSSCSILKNNTGINLLKGAVSSGPYIVSKVDSSSLVLIKNKFFKRRDQRPNKIIFESKMSKNKSDLIIKTTKEKISGYRRYPYHFLGSWYLSLNTQSPNLKNIKLRKVLFELFDKREFLSHLGWPLNLAQKKLIPFGMRGFLVDNLNLKNKKNKQLNKVLRDLGYSKTNKLSLNLLLLRRESFLIDREIWSTSFPSELIKLNVEELEYSNYIKKKNKYDYDLVFHGKSPGSIEPHVLLGSYHSNSIYNTSNIIVKTCDDLISSSIKESDLELRYKKYRDAENCVLSLFPVIPIASVKKKYLYIRKPWKLLRRNMFLLYPYKLEEWIKDEN